MAHVKRFDAMISELAGGSEASPLIDALMCFRGISITTGFGLAVEIGDWTRFTEATIVSHARPYSRPGARLLRQFEKVDAATRIRAIEGNQRSHRVWVNFDARKKRRVKANTAVARELAGWCWSVAAPLQMNVTGPEGQEARMG